VQEALGLVESLGMARLGNGHDLLAKAAAIACNWGLSGHDATYVALASLTDGVWLTADARAAAKVREKRLVRVLGR
jgi:predicted nucleic acid-binding protein